MQNPYESPEEVQSQTKKPNNSLHSFFAWYLAAFIGCELLWRLSAFVRSMDFLELPMIALHCPIAGFLDPSDSMVNDERTFFVALLFWAAVIPVAFRIPSRKRSPLIIAFAIIVTFAVASTAYVLVIGFSRKPVY